MVYLQAEIRRGFLRQIAQGAINGSATLGDTLLSFQASIYTPSFSKGRLLVSTSGNGQHGSFEMGVHGKQFTQENIFALSEQFLGILQDTLDQNLAVDTGIQSDTLNLFKVMCQDDRLVGVRTQQGDYTGLNIPSIGGVPNAG